MARSQPKDLNAEQRAEAALRLRSYGFRWAEVAVKCGYSSADVARVAVDRLRAKTRIESMQDYRFVIGQRLADMASLLQKRVSEGDLWAFDRLLVVTEQERKLYGLDAPTEAENNATPYNKRVVIVRPAAETPAEEQAVTQ